MVSENPGRSIRPGTPWAEKVVFILDSFIPRSERHPTPQANGVRGTELRKGHAGVDRNAFYVIISDIRQYFFPDSVFYVTLNDIIQFTESRKVAIK